MQNFPNMSRKLTVYAMKDFIFNNNTVTPKNSNVPARAPVCNDVFFLSESFSIIRKI